MRRRDFIKAIAGSATVCPPPAMICTGCLASPTEGTSVAAQVTSAAVMKCLIISLFRLEGECRTDRPGTQLAVGSVDAVDDGAVDDEPDRLSACPRTILSMMPRSPHPRSRSRRSFWSCIPSRWHQRSISPETGATRADWSQDLDLIKIQKIIKCETSTKGT